MVKGDVVTLKWTKPGMKGKFTYNILRNGASMGTTKGKSYKNKGIANGTYSYEVDAKDSNGNLIAQSNVLSVTVNAVPKGASIIDGAALYGSTCAGCHKSLASSNVMGKSASDIKGAINGDKGGMGALRLTDAQVQAIGKTLTTGFTRPECSTCHNADGSLKESGSGGDSVGSGEGSGD